LVFHIWMQLDQHVLVVRGTVKIHWYHLPLRWVVKTVMVAVGERSLGRAVEADRGDRLEIEQILHPSAAGELSEHATEAAEPVTP